MRFFTDIFTVKYDPSHSPLKLTLIVHVKSGLWAGGNFEFRFSFSTNYPEIGPSITCVSQVWHPNIDMDGKPCVNIIRTEWSPSYGIELLFNGILYVVEGFSLYSAGSINVLKCYLL